MPIGGGGLISGCAIAAKALRPAIRVFGVEPEDGNDTYLSLRAGSRVEIPMPQTIADGLRATKPGAITFPIIQKYVEDIVLVSDREIRDTMKFLLTRMKIDGRAERGRHRRRALSPQAADRFEARRRDTFRRERRSGVPTDSRGLKRRW